MTRSLDDANRAITWVNRMPYGRAQIVAALAEVERVETGGPEQAKAYALNTLVDAYCHGGEPEKAFVPFSRVVAWYDAHPEMFDDYDRSALFWSFKWIVRRLMHFPRVPWASIEAARNDMARRYAEAGYGPGVPAQVRWQQAWHRGAPDTAALFEAWRREPRDDMSDCPLCVAGAQVGYHLEEGRLDEGLRLLEATLADASIRAECSEEPESMLAHAQLAYLTRAAPGDDERATRAYRRCRAAIDADQAVLAGGGTYAAGPPRSLDDGQVRALCIEFLARTRNSDAAVRLLEDNAVLLVHAECPYNRLLFLTPLGAALHVLVDELGEGDRPVALDPALAIPATTLAELWRWVAAEADTLAGAFDDRNGTPHRREVLRSAWSVTAAPARLDLRVLTVATPAPDADGAVGASAVGGPGAPGAGAVAPERLHDDAVDPALTPEDDLAHAEAAVRAGRLEDAVALYLATATGFEATGALVDGGFARAEAGRLAWQLDDLDGARAALERAWRVLKAAATPVAFVAPVATCLGEVLARVGERDEAERVLAETAGSLDAALALPDATGVSRSVALSARDDLTWARVLVDDTRAILDLRAGEWRTGAEVSQSVAERYAGLGLIAQAGSAFERAGTAWTGRDDERARWCLESAVEGYRLAGQRVARARVADRLVALLQRLGRDDEAGAIAASS